MPCGGECHVEQAPCNGAETHFRLGDGPEERSEDHVLPEGEPGSDVGVDGTCPCSLSTGDVHLLVARGLRAECKAY